MYCCVLALLASLFITGLLFQCALVDLLDQIGVGQLLCISQRGLEPAQKRKDVFPIKKKLFLIFCFGFLDIPVPHEIVELCPGQIRRQWEGLAHDVRSCFVSVRVLGPEQGCIGWLID